MARIFISHSHVDEVEAIALSDWLISQGWGGEDDIFLDLDPKRGLVGGERWQEALKRNVRRCEAIVFLITPAWCKSDWCRAEFLFAKNLNKPIFGIIAKPIELSDVPIEMTAEWQLVDLTREGAQEDFSVKALSDGKAHNLSFNASELTRLKAGLENTGIDPSYFEWPPESEPNRAPYQGLRAMQSQDAGIFFGRDGQILEGLDRMRGLHDAPPPRMLVILGASGAGKSSYMRAGLLPRLKRDDRHFVVLDSIRPGGNVLTGETGFVAALKHTLEAHDIAASPRRIKQAIGKALEENGDPTSLHALLLQLASSHVDGQVEIEADENNKSAALPSIVIPIDQAEELYFNQDENGASEAKRFKELLSILARDERLNIILLLTIRSDSYQHMQLDTVLGGVEHQTLSLPPIAQGSYSQIILGPVQRLTMNSDRKLAIEEKLVERLLHDIAQGGAKDALPLLAFTLERLYSEYLEGDTLTLQDYEEMGGIRGSIEAAVEQAFKTADQRGDANIPMEKQARLALLKRGLIPYLASVDPEHNGAVRRVAPLSSIPQEARPIMELLVEQRLLATDTRPELDDKDEPTGKLETTIEPSHEALLRQWGQLGEWLEEDREALSALDGVKRAVIEWDANDKGEAFLAHTAGRLESAEQVVNDERFHDYLNQRDRNYLVACRKADNERRNQALEQQAKVTRRTRLALITVSILALFIGGIGLYALKQNEILEKQTQIAEEQKIELEKQKDELAKSLDQANKYLRSKALTAMSEKNYDDARSLMKEAWDRIDGTYDPDNPWSDYLAAAQRKLEYKDQLILALEGNGNSEMPPQYSPDGEMIAIGSWRGAIKLWDATTGTEIAILKGHKAAINSAQFSPDGKMIVTVSTDKTARVWNVETGEEITVLEGHEEIVNSAQFNPDGKMIVTASGDGTARVWDTKTGEEIAAFERHEDYVNSAYFSPDGQTILTASVYQSARIWNVESGEEITVLEEHEGKINSAQFSPDGNAIVTVSSDGTAKIWNAKTGESIAVLVGHKDSVNSAQFSPDGKKVVTASYDGTTMVWDTKTGEEISTFRAHNGSINSAQFSPDGKTIVTASADGTARVWNVETGEELVTLKVHGARVYSVQFSPDGKTIMTASADGTTRLWSTRIQREVPFMIDEEYPIYSAQLSPNGLSIVTTSYGRVSRVWNANTGEEIVAFAGHESVVRSAQFSPDGKTIATTSSDRTARLWNARTGKEIAVLDGHRAEEITVQFSPDGRTIFTNSEYDNLKIWNAETGEKIFVIENTKSLYSSPQFSPDGKMIVSSSEETVRIWDATTGEELATLEGHEDIVTSAQFSPDGKKIVTIAEYEDAKIWNAKSGEEIAATDGHLSSMISAQFSPDGKTIISTSEDRTARVWNAETGKEVFLIPSIMLAQFSPDGNTIITVPEDNKIKLWNVKTQRSIALLEGHGSRIQFAQFSNDGISLLTYDEDHKVILWDAKTGLKIDTFEIGRAHDFILTTFDLNTNLQNERILTLSNTGKMNTWYLPTYKNNNYAELNEARQMKPSSIDIEDSFSPNENEDLQVAQNLNACDAAGGHPFDPERIGPALTWETLTEEGFNREELIESCEKELAKQPDEQRLRFQLARALLSTQELENEKRAVDLYLEASENGYAIASYSAAIRYERGNEEAIKLDPKRSLELYELASSQGIIEANSPIAWAHWNGVGTEPNIQKAVQIYKDGASKGGALSQKNLAVLYEKGEREEGNTFIKQDLNMAFYHYAIATRLFEEAGLKESAQKTRYRRASLARTLPQDDVIRIWRDVKAWQPERL